MRLKSVWARSKALLLLAACSGCATWAAVQEAPPEFWRTAEDIVLAFFRDVWSVIEWIL